MRWICVIKTKLNKKCELETKETEKRQESKAAGFETSFGISTMLHSSYIKESCGSDGKSACLTRYQKVLGLIPS